MSGDAEAVRQHCCWGTHTHTCCLFVSLGIDEDVIGCVIGGTVAGIRAIGNRIRWVGLGHRGVAPELCPTYDIYTRFHAFLLLFLSLPFASPFGSIFLRRLFFLFSSLSFSLAVSIFHGLFFFITSVLYYFVPVCHHYDDEVGIWGSA